MYNKPEKYEEAKKLIEEVIDNDHEKHKLKVSKLRAMLSVALGISAAVVIGVVNQDSTLGALAVAPAMMVVSPFMVPYFIRIRIMNRIKNGEYFKDKSEDEIMKIANTYVDAYNDLEMKGKLKFSCWKRKK